MKTCSICGNIKDLSEFPKTGTFCKKCKAAKLRDRKITDPLYYIKRSEYRKNNKNKINAQKRSLYYKNPTAVINRNKAYYEMNRPHCIRRQREYQTKIETASMESWLAKCLKHSKASDKKYGRDNNIDVDFVNKLYEKQHGRCAITNVKMKHNRNDLFSASIDRINPSLGHIKGNIQIVCQAANLAKREYKNDDVFSFFKAVANEIQSTTVNDFDGFNYDESTEHYSMVKKEKVIMKMRELFIKFMPPTYQNDELIEDYNRICSSIKSEYYDGGIWRTHKPDSLGFAGKKIIWHHHPHLWDVRTQGKPLITEVWGNGVIFEKALINLVNGSTRISLDRIIRELIFAGAGIPSQIHPGFAKAVYSHFGCKAGDVIYDPFAGWGGRMLAAKSLNLQYHACELSTPTYDGLNAMAKFIDYKCDVKNIDYVNNKVDASFMFTSPPFGTEEYVGSQHTIDFNALLDVTNHIPVRVFHINRSMLNTIKFDEVIELNTRSQASSMQSHEFLGVFYG